MASWQLTNNISIHHHQYMIYVGEEPISDAPSGCVVPGYKDPVYWNTEENGAENQNARQVCESKG